MHSPSPNPTNFPGRCRIWKSPPAGVQVWEDRAPACLFSHARIYLLSYRKEEPELPYLSYLLWWHEEPQARQEISWWQLPLCGDKELWPGKEKKSILVKGWTEEKDGNNPHQSDSPHTWMGSCCRYQQLTTLPHLCWIHQTPQESEGRHVPLIRPGRSVPQPKEHSSLLYFLLNQLKGTQLPSSMRTWLPLLICHNLWTSSSLTQYKQLQSYPGNSYLQTTPHHTAVKSLNWCQQTWEIKCGIY